MADSPKDDSFKSVVPTREKWFDAKWLVFIIFIVVLVVGGIIINNVIGNTTADITGTNTIDVDNGDINTNWHYYGKYDIKLTDSVTITESGTYTVSGTLSDGGIAVNVKNGFVKLVLDNVSITNKSGPAIINYQSQEFVIELVGHSYVADSAYYDNSYDEDIKGAIYSKDDLSFTGNGTLTVKGNYQDGIVGKDDLAFRDGSFNVTAVDDGIRGKDSVHIVDGTFSIDVDKDAIKSTNETDTGKGFVYIEGGDITIDCGDDGIHAEKNLTISGGKIDIVRSYEGLEAPVISINDGDISIVSSDDGLNAASGTGSYDTVREFNRDAGDGSCVISINGGSLYVNAGGDGIDSNGYVYINGGKVVVDGPTNNGNGALDSGLGYIMKGGEAIAVGSSGMAETFGNKSTVNNISLYLSTTQKAGTKIEIKTSNGETILTHTSAKSFSHIAAASSKFENGETYILYINGEKNTEFTIDSATTYVGNGKSNMGPRR